MKVIIDCSKNQIGLKKDGLELECPIGSYYHTRCSTNMSKATCASVAKNQKSMRMKGK
jgi:hypothetical protein